MKLFLSIILLMFGLVAYAVPDKSLNDEVQIEISDIASDVVSVDLVSVDKADIAESNISIEQTEIIKYIIQDNFTIVQRIRPGEYSMVKSDYLNNYKFEFTAELFCPHRQKLSLIENMPGDTEFNQLE